MMVKTKTSFLFSLAFCVLICCATAFAGQLNNVKITNVRGTQFTVSWTSMHFESGKVRYGTEIENYESWMVAEDDRGESIKDDVHHVTVKPLFPDTDYFYEIVSGDQVDNNNGEYYRLNPGPALVPDPSKTCQPAGRIYTNKCKTELAYDTIVYLTILGGDGAQDSAVESMIVTEDTNGYWFMNLSNFRILDYQKLYDFTCDAETMLNVEAVNGNNRQSNLETEAIDYSPDNERPELFFEMRADGLARAIYGLQVLAGIEVCDPIAVADMNGDKRVDLVDAILILTVESYKQP